MKPLKIIIISISAIALLSACTVPEVVKAKTQAGEIVSVTNYAASPKLIQALETLGQMNAVTAGVNPYVAVIGWGIGVIGAAATFFTKLKNDRTNKLLKVTVQGIEQTPTGGNVKEQIEKHSANAGVALELDRIVQKIVRGDT